MSQIHEKKQVFTCSAKRRGTYQLLALLIGGLGVHNFYAGRKKVAFMQLGLTILQAVAMAIVACKAASDPHGAGQLFGQAFAKGLLGLGIARIWALVEIFVVKNDGAGLPFKKSFV